MRVRTLLILLDLSETTPSLLAYGKELAGRFGAQVWLLHVYHLPPKAEGKPFVLLDELADYEEQGRQKLSVIQQRMAESSGLNVRYEVSFGDLAIVMNSLITREHIDLVVMNNRVKNFSDKGIQRHIAQHRNDLVVLIPRTHDFL